MKPQLMAISFVAVAAIVSVGVYLGTSAGKEAAELAGFDWNGASFTMVTQDSEETITTSVDLTNNALKMVYTVDGSPRTMHTLSTPQLGVTWTMMKREIDGTTYDVLFDCQTGVDLPMASEMAPVGDKIGEGIKFENGEAKVQTENGEIVFDSAGSDSGAATIKLLDENEEEIETKITSLVLNTDGTDWDVPAACYDKEDPTNTDAMEGYLQASVASERRRFLESVPEEDRERVRKLSEEDYQATKRSLRVNNRQAETERMLWGWAKGQLSIDMHYHRYCGPNINGCQVGGGNCGGPVSEVDKCCAMHDYGCGHDESKTGNTRTMGAYNSAVHGGGGNCWFGFHAGGKCEHCGCSAKLASCAGNAIGKGSCYNGVSPCDASWTAGKVAAVFNSTPCWYKGSCTKWTWVSKWYGGYYSRSTYSCTTSTAGAAASSSYKNGYKKCNSNNEITKMTIDGRGNGAGQCNGAQ